MTRDEHTLANALDALLDAPDMKTDGVNPDDATIAMRLLALAEGTEPDAAFAAGLEQRLRQSLRATAPRRQPPRRWAGLDWLAHLLTPIGRIASAGLLALLLGGLALTLRGMSREAVPLSPDSTATRLPTVTPAPGTPLVNTLPAVEPTPKPNPRDGIVTQPLVFTAPDPVPAAATMAGTVWVHTEDRRGMLSVGPNGERHLLALPRPEDALGLWRQSTLVETSADQQLFAVGVEQGEDETVARGLYVYSRRTQRGLVVSLPDNGFAELGQPLVLSADGRQLVFTLNTSQTRRIALLDTETGAITQLATPFGQYLRPIAWPQTTALYLESVRPPDGPSEGLYRLDPSNPGSVAPLVQRNLRGPVLSPDGAWVAYLGEEADGTRGVFLLNVATGREQRIALEVGVWYGGRLAWSPDAQSLLVGLNDAVPVMERGAIPNSWLFLAQVGRDAPAALVWQGQNESALGDIAWPNAETWVGLFGSTTGAPGTFAIREWRWTGEAWTLANEQLAIPGSPTWWGRPIAAYAGEAVVPTDMTNAATPLFFTAPDPAPDEATRPETLWLFNRARDGILSVGSDGARHDFAAPWPMIEGNPWQFDGLLGLSPDNQTLFGVTAMEGEGKYRNGIYVYHRQTGQGVIAPLPEGTYYDIRSEPVLSPDGRHLAVVVTDSANNRWPLVLLAVEQGSVTVHDIQSGLALRPFAWPQPDTLLFEQVRSEAPHLGLFQGDPTRAGSLSHILTRDLYGAVLSPDGTGIAYAGYDNTLGRSVVYLLDLATRQEQVILLGVDHWEATRLVWSPDGQSLLVAANNSRRAVNFNEPLRYWLWEVRVGSDAPATLVWQRESRGGLHDVVWPEAGRAVALFGGEDDTGNTFGVAEWQRVEETWTMTREERAIPGNITYSGRPIAAYFGPEPAPDGATPAPPP